jgi:hypothetical protein
MSADVPPPDAASPLVDASPMSKSGAACRMSNETFKGTACMLDPRINLKTRWLAALLAFLVPGAGHVYQGRYFKGAIYAVCILGLFVAGMRMSDWKAVYVHYPRDKQAATGKLHWLQFAAQFGVGLPALCAIVQNYRYYDESNERVEFLDAPLRAPFDGTLTSFRGEPPARFRGTIELAPAETDYGGRTVRGHLRGTGEDGREVEIALGGRFVLDERVKAEKGRQLTVSVVEEGDSREQESGTLDGAIPRPAWNWFAVPLDVHQERELHSNLGKYFELAMVFTWVAGLLNLLAIWDALEGPAYGYGDESKTEAAGAAGKKADLETKPAPDQKRAAAEVTA